MAKRKSSGWLKWLLILVLLGGGAGAWWKLSGDAAARPPELKTATIAMGDLVQQVTANGSLNPVRQVEVGSQISGTLLDVKVDFNSRVKAGDVLAQIDPATYERALVQAEAELANAMAALELSQVNYNRAEELFAAKLISKAEFDTTKANYSQAQAVVKTREANVERAKVDLSRCTIFSPIDGIVITRRIEVGQTVAASLNTPTLFVIANDLSKMRIEAAVSEADVGGVTEEQTVNFTVEAFPSRKFRGIVQQVRFAPTTNQNVVTYTTVVEVDNRDLKLRPGMTADAKIVTAERKGVVLIPNSALRFRPPAGVIVLQDARAGGGAKPKGNVEIATSGPFEGLPIPPWQAEGARRRPSDEERAAYEASLTPEQKEKYQQVMADMRARFAQFAQGGGSGGGGERQRRAESEGPRSQTVYLVDKSSAALKGGQSALRPVTVRLGITDGNNTEVIEGLKEGDVVATGTMSQAIAAAPAAAGGSPFGSPFGGRPRTR